MQEVIIRGEYALLMACLTTLLTNSSKHMEKNGKIKISCGVSDTDKYIQIIDQGSIYSSNQIDNITCFFSEDKKTLDFTPGIELMLAKQIMISHGGKVVFNAADAKSISTKMVFPLAT
jgi:K+-sensing histidine kinase KdpD